MDFVIFTLDSTISLAKAANVSVTGFVVVLLILALLAVLVRLLSQGIRGAEGVGKKKHSTTDAQPAAPAAAPIPAPAPAAAQQSVSLPDNCSAGQLELYDVDEKSAAVIMAIVSHESGVPLNRLLFKSIKAIRK